MGIAIFIWGKKKSFIIVNEFCLCYSSVEVELDEFVCTCPSGAVEHCPPPHFACSTLMKPTAFPSVLVPGSVSYFFLPYFCLCIPPRKYLVTKKREASGHYEALHLIHSTFHHWCGTLLYRFEYILYKHTSHFLLSHRSLFFIDTQRGVWALE